MPTSFMFDASGGAPITCCAAYTLLSHATRTPPTQTASLNPSFNRWLINSSTLTIIAPVHRRAACNRVKLTSTHDRLPAARPYSRSSWHDHHDMGADARPIRSCRGRLPSSLSSFPVRTERENSTGCVLSGLVPLIHVFGRPPQEKRMAGTRPAITERCVN